MKTPPKAHEGEAVEDTCGSCIFRRSRRIGDNLTEVCTCWHVKGKDGGYKSVKPKTEACRWYMPKHAAYDVEDRR